MSWFGRIWGFFLGIFFVGEGSCECLKAVWGTTLVGRAYSAEYCICCVESVRLVFLFSKVTLSTKRLRFIS